jgi:hypothetical protein
MFVTRAKGCLIMSPPPRLSTMVERVGYVQEGVQGKIFSWRKHCNKRCKKQESKKNEQKCVNLHGKGTQVGLDGGMGAP